MTAPSPTAANQGRPPVRLTRRGRVVVLLALLVLLLVAFTLGRVATSQAATGHPHPPTYQQTTVHTGESLWAVARRVAPGHDPRQVIDKLRALNHLSSAIVIPGQQLLVPTIA